MRSVGMVLALGAAAAVSAAPQLTLAEARQMALQNHPRLQAGRAAAQAAAERPAEFQARHRPQAFASVTGALAEDANTRILAGGLNNPLILSRAAAGAGVSQMITDFGRTKHLVASAAFEAEAAREGTAITRAQILLRVHQLWYAALGAQAVLRVAAETVKARELLAQRAQALAANKLKSELDVSFAQVDLQEARLLESNARNAARSALVELGEALGLAGPAEFDLAEEEMPPPLPPDAEEAVRQAASQRPELAQARLARQSAQEQVAAEKALRYPTIRGVISTGVSPAHGARLQGHWNAAGLNVDLPFLNGGEFRARQRRAEAQERAAAASAQDVAHRIARDVRLAYLNAANAWQRLGLNEALVEQARRAASLAEARYDLGLGTIVEVSQAQLSLTRALIAQAGARFDYQAARAALDYQSGAF